MKHKGTHVNETQSSVCVSSWFAITNSSTRCDGVCLYSAYLSSDWQEGNFSEANLGYVQQATVSEKNYY